MPKKVPNLEVGCTCRYFTGGETSLEPHAAFVVKSDGMGMLVLQLMSTGGWSGKKQTVRHKDDPYNLTHPTVVQRFGTWDFVKGREKLDLELHGCLADVPALAGTAADGAEAKAK